MSQQKICSPRFSQKLRRQYFPKFPSLSITYIFIFELHDFFFFNQGSSGGLPTLGIQDVLRAILVELDDWLKLVAYSSNPIHSFPPIKLTKKKGKKKRKIPSANIRVLTKKTDEDSHCQIVLCSTVDFCNFWYAFLSPC